MIRSVLSPMRSALRAARFSLRGASRAAEVSPRSALRTTGLSILVLGVAAASGCKVVEDLTEPENVQSRAIQVQASTTELPDGGGDVDVTATVTLGGAPEAGVTVVFESSAGSWLPDDRAATDGAGKVVRTLRTTASATVSAKVQAGGVTLVTSAPIQIEVGGVVASADVAIKLETTPKKPAVGESATLEIEATNKDDGSWATGTLAVQFGDGRQSTVGGFTGQTTMTHTWKEASLFNVVIELTDASGAMSNATFPVRVEGEEKEEENAATAVILTAKKEELPAREPLVFKLRPENDKGRLAAGKVKIDWGDGRATNLGTIDSVTEVEHIFREPGSYRVLAEIPGGRGSQARSSVRIRVMPPITVSATLSASDTAPTVDQTVTFSFTATQSDGKAASGNADVNFGDGTTTSVGVSGTRIFDHVYVSTGGFDVRADFVDTEGRRASASVHVSVQEKPTGGGGGGGDDGGGGGSGSGGTGGGGGGGADEIDPNSVVWLHDNAANWAVTSTVTGTSISDAEICIAHTKAGQWPVISSIEGNPWIIANIGGTWYAGTYEWLRPGQICKSLSSSPPSTTTASLMGQHIKVPPMSSWTPQSGQTVYLFVSTPARGGLSTIDQRSNIVKTIWP